MIHVDVKKVGRIPDGGGWRVHGKGSPQAKAVASATRAGTRAGYVYLHSAIDGFSRLAYTEALADEKAVTAIGFMHRARVWFAAPRHNGKVERYNRILAEEFLYARTWTSEAQRTEALKVWNIHFNYHRPHSAAAGQPPASRLATGVTNVMASYN